MKIVSKLYDRKTLIYCNHGVQPTRFVTWKKHAKRPFPLSSEMSKLYSVALKITQGRVLMRSVRINLSKDFVVQQLHWWPNRKSDNKFYSNTTE